MILTTHDVASIASTERGAIKLRHGDDQAMLAKAVNRAGGERELAWQTKVGVKTIRHIVRGQASASDAVADAISDYLDTTPVNPLRRSAMSYCPSFAQTVPESHMRTQISKFEWVTMDQCKTCAMSLRIVSSRAKQSSGRR